MKFLLDPVWIGVIIGLMGIFIPLAASIVIHIKQRTFKEITYEVISNILLLDNQRNCSGKIKLRINRKSLSNVNIVTLKSEFWKYAYMPW